MRKDLSMASVLILEDEEDFGALLRQSLEATGHSVVIRHNATAAIAAYKEADFDIVVADLIVKVGGRPVPDGGLTLIPSLRRLARGTGRRLPIIAISGVTQYPGLSSALEVARTVGADASLEKPFDPADLIALIEDLLNRKVVV